MPNLVWGVLDLDCYENSGTVEYPFRIPIIIIKADTPYVFYVSTRPNGVNNSEFDICFNG